MHHCTNCDSTDVEQQVWRKLNSPHIVSWGRDGGCEVDYCNKCQSIVTTIWKEEEVSKSDQRSTWTKELHSKEEVLAQIENWRQHDGAWGEAACDIFVEIENFLTRSSPIRVKS